MKINMNHKIISFINLLILFTAPTLQATTPVAAATINQADQYFQQGQLEQATKQWEQILATLPADAPSSERLELLLRLATAYQNLGMYRQVFKMLEPALSIIEQTKDAAQSAIVLSQFSDAWLTVGDAEEAKARAQDAVEDADTTNNPKLLAMALNSLGNALTVLGEYEEALATYQDSIEQAEQAGEGMLTLKASLNRLKAAVAYSPLSEVVTAMQTLPPTLLTVPDNHEKASLLMTFGNLGQNLLHTDNQLAKSKQAAQQLLSSGQLLRDYEKVAAQASVAEVGLTPAQRQMAAQLSYQAFQESGQLAKSLPDTSTEANAYAYLGQLYETEGRYEEALTLTRQAIFFVKQGHYPHILYRCYWQQGRIFKAQGLHEESIAAYRLANDVLRPIQQILDVGYRFPPGSFDEMVRPVYYELADLLLAKAETITDPTAKQRLLLEARDTIESVKVAELQNYFNDECVTAMQKKSKVLEQAVPRIAVLYPIPLQERLVVLVSLAAGIQQIVIPVRGEEVNETAWRLRLGLQTRPNNRFLYQAQKLYDWLIRPIETQLVAQQVDTIVVVPDGKLRMIPFSTLHDGKHFLIEKFAIVTTPGLTLTDPQPINWQDSKMLLIGLSDAVQDYPPLGNVPKEIKTIQDIVGANRTHRMMNSEYSIESFHDQLKATEYSVIHLATHGEFDADPDHTYLLTYQSKMTMDKLQGIIGLGKFRDKPVELLTLSACKTAVGNDKAALGLAGVALKAGARSAIATLWFVDDEATSIVISEFYQQLLHGGGLSKAKSLQNAQKKLIVQDRYWHPGYWAPFLLIGNWL